MRTKTLWRATPLLLALCAGTAAAAAPAATRKALPNGVLRLKLDASKNDDLGDLGPLLGPGGGNIQPAVPAATVNLTPGASAPNGTAYFVRGTVVGGDFPGTGEEHAILQGSGDFVALAYRTAPSMKDDNLIVTCQVRKGDSAQVTTWALDFSHKGPVASSASIPVNDGKLRFLVDPSPDRDGKLVIKLSPAGAGKLELAKCTVERS